MPDRNARPGLWQPRYEVPLYGDFSASRGTWLIVVGNAPTPIASDYLYIARVRALGFQYFLVSDDDAEISDLSPYVGIIISESVSGATVAAKYATARLPMLVGEGVKWVNDGLVVAQGNVVGENDWRLVTGAAGHPLAAGYTGDQIVGAGDWRIVNIADFGGGAATVQQIWYGDVGIDTLVVEFAYEANAAVNVGTAPARRVGLGFHNTNNIPWTIFFEDVVDAAIEWLLGTPIHQMAPLWQEQPGQEAGNWPRWLQPDDAYEGLTPPSAFNPTVNDFGYDASLDLRLPARWFAPDAETKLPATPPGNGPVAGGAVTYPQPLHATVTWTDPPGGSSALASIDLYRGTAQFSPIGTWVLLGTIPAGTQTFDDYYGDLADYIANLAAGFRYFGIAKNVEGLVGAPYILAGDSTGLALYDAPPLYDQQAFVSNAARWYQSDLDTDSEGLTPLVSAYSGHDIGWDAQQDRWTQPRWHQPDDSLAPRQPAGFDPASFPWQEQPQDAGPRWSLQPDDAYEGLTPLANAFTGSDIGWDAQQDRWQPARWFQPDTEVLTTVPNLTTATVDQLAALWPEQPGQERPNARQWVHPPDPTEATPPGTPPAFDPALMDFGYDAQTDRSIQPVWHAPDAQALGDVPRVNAQTHPDLGWDGVADRSNAQQWYQEPDDALGIPPFAPSTATVAQQAGLWQDSSPQQDRSIQPVWHAPDAAQDVLQPLAPPPTTATVPEQAALWAEQPYPERGNQPVWYSQAVEPVDGPLQSWLFTTGAPTPPGVAPAVLINAKNGDVFLYVGSNFIVPAL